MMYACRVARQLLKEYGLFRGFWKGETKRLSPNLVCGSLVP